MGQDSKIEWTHHTFNPWWGCVRVSPGCEHCYAETFAKRVGLNVWGPAKTTERRLFGEKHWAEPLKWNKQAGQAGERRRVFCASMADVFEEHPQIETERWRLWDLIEETPALDWLLLTKRPENIIANTARWAPWGPIGKWPDNIWIGTTVENQEQAEKRIPILLNVPARVRFLSCEPLLGPVDLDQAARHPDGTRRPNWGLGIHWVICGGESGHGARPMNPEWARSLRDQCQAAGVAYHFKQWGEYRDGARLGKHAAGRLLDGREWNEYPA